MIDPEKLIAWYRDVYTRRLVNSSNISPEVMRRNLAVLNDAISQYRDDPDEEYYLQRESRAA